MRRAIALSWALGTATGVLLGLFGVYLVTSGITGERITPLSRPEVLQALSAASAPAEPPETVPPTTPAPTDTGSAPPLPDPVPTPATTPPASAPPRPGAPSGPTPTTTAATAPPAPPPAPPASPPQVVNPPPPPPPAPTTTTTVPPGETRTITSRGGTVAVRYLDGEVNLLWARPNDGYDVEVIDDGPGRVFVRFRSDRARSRVYAYYVDGQPTQNVDEQGGGRDKGDGDRSSSEFDGDGRHRR